MIPCRFKFSNTGFELLVLTHQPSIFFNQLGHVPKPGERISTDTTEIKVRRVVRARIQEVELRLKPKPTVGTPA